VSLLMDALRKAEQQKQQGAAPDAAGNGGAGNLSLEPLPDQTASPRPAGAGAPTKEDISRRLPELPKRMEELDDQFFTSDPALQKSIRALAETKTRETPPSPSAGVVGASPSREAAQNVFAAKQPAPAIGHGFAITVSIATVVAIAAIGGYVYWQMQPKGSLAAGPALVAKQPASTPQVPASQVGTAISSSVPAAREIEPPASNQPTARKEVESTATATLRSPSVQSNKLAQAAPPQLAEHPDTVIRLSTKSRKPDESMETAHAAFTRGETGLARSIWLKTLQSDSRNSNALHGLAAIAQQEGKPEQAAALYRRVLEVDPKDAVAYAGLLSITTPVDVRQTESQLKGLLAEQPNSPHLNFALGNLYMGDSRWAEAQQAFFKAHVADPVNPDYLYNLAVSLDHLHQASLAAQYYARALVAAKSQIAAFDPAQAEERMKALQAGKPQ
jgi:tetratricopeptide (TPR) repeat protein